MTDLLSIDDTHDTPATNNTQGTNNTQDGRSADDRRTFRAATLDAAVEAARAELGPDVELIEAHRVRRGGLGGFFATDLGVEIIAAPSSASASAATSPSMPSHTGMADADDFAAQLERAAEVASARPAQDTAPTTGIDRLIEHAESHDRIIAPDHSDLIRSMHDAPIGEDELVSAPVSVDVAKPAKRDESTDEWFAFPDDEVSSLVADGLPESALSMAPDITPSAASNAVSEVESFDIVDPDVEAANWLDQVMSKDASELEMDDDFWADEDATPADLAAAAIDIGPGDDETTEIARPAVPGVAIEVSSDRDIDSSLTPTGYDRVAGQLVESLWALGERNDRKLHGVSVTITLDDGATVSVAAEFTGDSR